MEVCAAKAQWPGKMDVAPLGLLAPVKGGAAAVVGGAVAELAAYLPLLDLAGVFELGGRGGA